MTISHAPASALLLAHVPELADAVDSCEEPTLGELLLELGRRLGTPARQLPDQAFLERVASGLEAVLASEDPDARLLVGYALLDDLAPSRRAVLEPTLGPRALALLAALEAGALDDEDLCDDELDNEPC